VTVPIMVQMTTSERKSLRCPRPLGSLAAILGEDVGLECLSRYCCRNWSIHVSVAFFGSYLPVSVIFRPVDYQTGTWVDSKRYVVVDRQPLSRGPLLAIVEGHERRSRNGRVLRGSLGRFPFSLF